MDLNQKIYLKKLIREELDRLDSQNLNNNFWKWFGNSKIVENGEPMVCFHGSNDANIKSFDINKVGHSSGNYGHYGYGFYFSTDIREAKTYGNHIYKCYIKIKNPFFGTDDEILKLKRRGMSRIDDLEKLSIDFQSFKESFKQNPIVYRFLFNVESKGEQFAWDEVLKKDVSSETLDLLNDIQQVFDYTTLNDNASGIPDFVFKDLKKWGIKPKINKGFIYNQSLHWITDLGNYSKEFTEVVKKMGYDGVFYGSEIIPFYPNQIKSIENDGSWDVNDDNIYS